jgi:hypothetical protein
MKQRFTYQVMEGDAMAVGREEARALKRVAPGAIPFFANPLGGNATRLAEAESLLKMTDEWCPGLVAEIEGFAKELGIALSPSCGTRRRSRTRATAVTSPSSPIAPPRKRDLR